MRNAESNHNFVRQMYFDPNAKPHHQLYHQKFWQLEDIHIDEIKLKEYQKFLDVVNLILFKF